MSSRKTSLRVASGARDVTLDHERRPRVGPVLHEQESLPRLELVLRGGSPRTFRFDLDRVEAEGGLLLQDSTTVRAVARLVLVRMSTPGAVHARPPVALGSPRRWSSRGSTSTSRPARNYRPTHEGSTGPRPGSKVTRRFGTRSGATVDGARPKRRGSERGRVHHRPGATSGVPALHLEHASVRP